MSTHSPQPRTYRAGRTSATAGTGMFATIPKPERVAFYDRSIVLSRLFSNDPQSWVLKGGTALIWRNTTARATRDLDLYHSATYDIDEAIAALRTALGEVSTAPEDVHLVIRDEETTTSTQGNRQQAQVRVHLRSAAGMTLSTQPVKIDLVVGCRVTGDVDAHPADGLEKVLRAEVPAIRLYPIVDHLADKVAATLQTYPTHQGETLSGRVHDLIDIAHIAATETIDGTRLHTALESERLERGLPPYEQGFQCPPAWATLYAKRKGSKGQAPASFDEALDLAKRLLDPAILGEAIGMTWDQGTWRP